ncbi:MAG: hypothetical protein ABIR47_01120 [Candidatus Kapaibacterium sp.]
MPTVFSLYLANLEQSRYVPQPILDISRIKSAVPGRLFFSGDMMDAWLVILPTALLSFQPLRARRMMATGIIPGPHNFP